MKKILLVVLAMAFVGVGSVYAADRWGGVTDMTGRSYDDFNIGINGRADLDSIESSSAGGLRVGKDMHNGVTDFTGKSYDNFEIGQAGTGAMNEVESSSAGGLRTGDKEVYNGVTDFSGKSYDNHEIRG